MLTVDPFKPAAGSSKGHERQIRTVCRECTVGCGLWAFIQGDHIVDVQGDETHPVNRWGVSRGVHMMYQMEFFPVGYFEDVCWPELLEKYAAPAYVEKNQLKNVGCYCCPNRCMNFFSVPHLGKGVTSCEPFSGFTGAVWNLDMDVFWEATLLVNKLGLDCTETSAAIGLLMELYHHKLITAQDTDGIAMERGSKEAIPTSYRGKARSAVISEHLERVADNLGISKGSYPAQHVSKFEHNPGGKAWNQALAN